MKAAVAYLRESTARQELGLAAQTERIRHWCETHGYTLVGTHTDAGISGRRTTNRPGLQAALNQACTTPNAALVVYSLSRLARSTIDAIEIAERLDKANCDLVSLSESIDTTTAAGRMIFKVLAVLAEFERDLLSERTLAALNVKRQRGEKLGGTVPIGYRVVRGKLVLDEDQIPQIRRVWELRRSGLSEERTAIQMARETGKSWNRSRVVQIMKSAALADVGSPVRLALPSCGSCESSESHNAKSANGSV